MNKFDFSLLSKIKDELQKNNCSYVMCPYIFVNHLVRNLNRKLRSKFLFKYYEDHNLVFKMLDVDWRRIDDSIYSRSFVLFGMDKTNAVLAKLLGNDVVEMDDLLNVEIELFSPPYYTKWYLEI